jgi:hypothetical protein
VVYASRYLKIVGTEYLERKKERERKKDKEKGSSENTS